MNNDKKNKERLNFKLKTEAELKKQSKKIVKKAKQEAKLWKKVINAHLQVLG